MRYCFVYGVKLYEGKEGIAKDKAKALKYLKKINEWGDCSAYKYLVAHNEIYSNSKKEKECY